LKNIEHDQSTSEPEVVIQEEKEDDDFWYNSDKKIKNLAISGLVKNENQVTA
jgi:hypothetical protein